MSIARLSTLLVVLICGLGTVFFIPRQTQLQPSRIKMELPATLGIGEWKGKDAPISEKEHEILAGDTEFCRKVYTDAFGDEVLVSIVLSGHDLDNSIHRPERCLPAQGWTIEDTSALSLSVPEAPGSKLPVTRLHDFQQVNVKGQAVKVYNLNYYWFIGYSDITASHLRREYLDMKDRLLHGYNQRWAYVTVAATITKDFSPYGKDQAQTDEMIQKIIAEVFPLIVPSTAGDADKATAAR